MSEWISVKDRLPEHEEAVKFLHHGYEFEGRFIHRPFPFPDALAQREWFFTGSQKSGGRVHTIHVTHWMPLSDVPNE